MTWAAMRVVWASVFVCLAASAVPAQTTTTSETKRFQIIAVNGNELVVNLPEGTRELTVGDDFRFNMDGKSLTVAELKPGMEGTAVITRTTTVTPVTATRVENATVVQSSGGSITVRTNEGFRVFTQSDVDKRGVKILRDGRPAQISDFVSGDRLTATIITAMPPKVLSETEVQATLNQPAPPAATPAPAVAAAAPPEPAPVATTGNDAPAPAATTGVAQEAELPKTAGPVPLIGLIGLVSLAAGLVVRARRRRAAN